MYVVSTYNLQVGGTTCRRTHTICLMCVAGAKPGGARQGCGRFRGGRFPNVKQRVPPSPPTTGAANGDYPADFTSITVQKDEDGVYDKSFIGNTPYSVLVCGIRVPGEGILLRQ